MSEQARNEVPRSTQRGDGSGDRAAAKRATAVRPVEQDSEEMRQMRGFPGMGMGELQETHVTLSDCRSQTFGQYQKWVSRQCKSAQRHSLVIRV